MNMNFQNEVFRLARVRISEVRINEDILYCKCIADINLL